MLHPLIRFFFTDTQTHWAKTYIQTLKTQCNVFGYQDEDGNDLNIFKPDFKISRYELITIVVRCKYGLNVSVATSSPFPDVKLDHWAVATVKKAYDEKIITGYPDGTFKGDKTANRAEALAIMIRAFATPVQIEAAPVSAACTDIDQNLWYANIFNFAIDDKIIEGTKDKNGQLTGKCLPNSDITRAESAKVIIEASNK